MRPKNGESPGKKSLDKEYCMSKTVAEFLNGKNNSDETF
jgi:hypothetical protein